MYKKTPFLFSFYPSSFGNIFPLYNPQWESIIYYDEFAAQDKSVIGLFDLKRLFDGFSLDRV